MSNWLALSNSFEVATRTSNKLALSLFTDHEAKLLANADDADIASMHQSFKQYSKNYSDAYSSYQMATGTYSGKTMSFEEVLTELNNLIPFWEGQVHYYFPEGNPTEKEIFPNKRGTFQKGTYEQRVNAVKTLAVKLKEFPQMAALQSTVDSFFIKMEATRLLQQSLEGRVKSLSSLLEEQRLLVADEMYANLGRLMTKFARNRERIRDFFDMEIVQYGSSSSSSSEFSQKDVLGAGAIATVNFKNKELSPDTVLKISVLGAEGSASFYFAAANTDVPAQEGIRISMRAGETKTLAAMELGYDAGAGLTLLNIMNTGTAAIEWKVGVE